MSKATDLSRREVDRAHRKEIEAARTEIRRLNATLDVVTADRDTWRDDYHSAIALVEAAEADRDERHAAWLAAVAVGRPRRDVPPAAPKSPQNDEPTPQ